MLQFFKITFFGYKSLRSRWLLLLLLLFSYSSCSDKGCIEADDFGDYEQEIVTVKANGSADSCNYDANKDLTDVSQGSGLKSCFTSGNMTISYNSVLYLTDNKGCTNFNDEIVKRLCIDQCISNCNATVTSSPGVEPNWVSTSQKISGQNSGVTITPNSKIYIKVSGNVVLSDAINADVFTKSIDANLQSVDAKFNPIFMDVRGGSTKNIKFSGKWQNTNTTTNYGGNDANSVDVYNGAKRLVAYVIPHPNGYRFDTSVTAGDKRGEKERTMGVPLFADTDLWRCNYDGSGPTQSNCYSLTYNKDSGYPNIPEKTYDSAIQSL